MRCVKCPKCGIDISDSHQEEELDVGIPGGWYCDACDITIPDYEYDEEL